METCLFTPSFSSLPSMQGQWFPSPAKLNLFLYINGRLSNGYHELQTLFQFLNIGDWLNIQPNSTGKIVLTSPIANLKTEDNLIYRAAKLLQQKTGCTQGADIYLHKILPIGGGIGGGSSNAATTLIALNNLWNTKLNLIELADLGLQLGADVPIFIYGKAAFAEGVGEKLTSCQPQEKAYLVLKPKVEISTAQVFNHPNLTRNSPKKSLAELLNRPYSNDCESIVKQLYPEVKEAINWLSIYAPARLTGTGACVFAQFTDIHQAQEVFKQKPDHLTGFVAQGLNISPLHLMLENRMQSHNLLTLQPNLEVSQHA